MPAYKAAYPDGSKVRIASRTDLEEFKRSWKYHDPLTENQLDYANQVATIRSHGYYFGGDTLYWLQEFAGTWHEVCLRPVENLK